MQEGAVMRHRRFWIVAALSLAASMAGAQPPSIVHEPVACAVAEKFPRLTARFDPSDNVAVARLLFQGSTAEWYSVTMKQEGAVFAGVLPKPRKDLKSFRYYIEVTDRTASVNRTAEFTTLIVPSSGACKGGVVSATVATASVLLQGPAGIVSIPGGFASTGVVAGTATGSGGAAGATGAATAGGGGLGTAALVATGVAAAGGAAVALKGGGDGNNEGGDQTVVRSYALEGFVYKTLPNGAPAVGAIVSSSVDSTTTTTNAQGYFILRPQGQCLITPSAPTGPSFTLRIAAAGCPVWSETKTWGCANQDGSPAPPALGAGGINLNCR